MVLMAKNDQVEGLQIGIFTRDNAELKPYKDLSASIDSDIKKRLIPVGK
jgi:hypothetical protein